MTRLSAENTGGGGNRKRRNDSTERRAAYRADHVELVAALCTRKLARAVSV